MSYELGDEESISDSSALNSSSNSTVESRFRQDAAGDKETKVLTTLGEEEERENCAGIESAAWYRDKVGEHMEDNKKNR